MIRGRALRARRWPSGLLLLGALLAACGQDPSSVTGATEDSPSTPSAVHAPQGNGTQGAEKSWSQRERELLERIDALQRALRERDERLAQREEEMLAYLQAVSSLPVPGTPEPPAFLLGSEDPAQVALREQEAQAEAARRGMQLAREERAARRAEELRVDLRALLMAERVHALDVLEVGRPDEGWTGPVVVRLVDEDGRPSGMLAADRLRLECSRSGRVVTLVFEEGYELLVGQRVPFGPATGDDPERGGVRRVRLDGVDPAPWLEALPELFDPDRLEEPVDDGRWDLVLVRQAVNELLRSDTRSGIWRLGNLGGVVAGSLREVQLAELDEAGEVRRLLFADELQVEAHGEGVRLTLLDGVQERAGVRTPFVDGRLRLHLLRADVELGRRSGVPGLARPPRE